MRILFIFVALFCFAVSLFAGENKSSIQQDNFKKAVNEARKGILSQYSTQVGKDGIKITCTLIPSRSVAAAVWEIENPNNKTITIKSEDISLYAEKRKFRRISPAQAIEAHFNWGDDSDALTPRQEFREDLRGSPGQDSKESLMRSAALKFGESSEAVINGITFFNCRLRELEGVTAEIKVDNQTFKFPFEGGKSRNK